MALDVESIPEPAVDLPGAGDAGGADPSLDEMQAMIDAPGDAPIDPPAAVPAPAAPLAPAAEAPKDPVAVDPAAPAAPDIAALAADQVKLRKGWAALARDKEALVQKTNDANAAVARSKAHEEKAGAYEALPKRFAEDPFSVMFELAGAKTLEDQEAFTTALLDKVVESEKSPVEREVMRLRREIEQKEADAKKQAEDKAAKDAEAANQKIIDDWTARNVNFASSSPENVKKYDVINALRQGEAVHQTCLAYYNLHKVVLDLTVAADHVEKHLRDGLERSEYVKQRFAAPPAPPAPAPKPAAPRVAPAAPAAAPTSNGSNAPKKTGPTTLAAVASGDGAPSSADFPEDSDARYEAVMRDMQAAGELPDTMRFSSGSQ